MEYALTKKIYIREEKIGNWNNYTTDKTSKIYQK